MLTAAAAIALTALTAIPICGALDLGTLLDLASVRSDEVSIRRAELESARADLALAAALRIVPEASATLLVGPAPAAQGNVMESPDSNRNPLRDLSVFMRVEANVVQPLYTWGRIDAASEAAGAGVRARIHMVRDQVSRVQERIARLYWADALAARLLVIAADVESALVEVDRRVASSLARGDGSITATDRYRIDVFHGLVRQRTADARRGRDLARTGLAATLAIPPERLVLQAARLEVDDAPVPQDAEARARAEAFRPDLKAIAEAVAAQDAKIRAEEAAAMPQIFAGGVFAYSYAPNRQIQTNPWVRDYFNEVVLGLAVGARVDLAMPMLSARAEKARTERATLERQMEGLRDLVAAEVNGALIDLRSASDRLEAARRTLASGKAWFRAAGLDFSAGLNEPRDLLDAYAGYVETQVWYAQASFDVLVARARLALATGELQARGEPGCQLP